MAAGSPRRVPVLLLSMPFPFLVEVWDTRPCAPAPHSRIAGAARAAFLALREPGDERQVREELAREHGPEEAEAALRELDELRLVFAEGGRIVHVAVAAAGYRQVAGTPQTSFVRAEKLRLLERVRELVAGEADAVAPALA
jgi:hypothetical protein